jgi:type IV pilus assembly protein PilY1
MVVADAIRLLPANSLPDLEVAISQSSDDAGGPNLEYEGNCGDENSDRPEVYLGHCEDGSSTISGFRFQNVVIPDGATVAAARLEFTVDTTEDDAIDVQFHGELAGDAATFSVGDLPSDRISSLTNAAVPWHIANDGGWWVSEAQVSPDLSTVIQEVIDQPDWNSGNAIVIIMQPTSAGDDGPPCFWLGAVWGKSTAIGQAANLVCRAATAASAD